MQNMAKAICSAWTGGIFIDVPINPMKKEYKSLARLSHAYAWLADLSLIYLGGDLKRRERVSAVWQMACHIYTWLWLLCVCAQATKISRWTIDAKWAVNYCFYHAQKSLLSLCHNFPSKALGWVMRLVAFPFGQTMHAQNDKLEQQLAR